MPRKTVFIFGAGASKADGLPTQAELLKGYFSNNPQDDFSVALNRKMDIWCQTYTLDKVKCVGLTPM